MEESSDSVSRAGFLNAVVLAGRAFVAAKGKDPMVEGGELVKFLLSDDPLSRAERELLAELVTGEWRRPAGRTPVTPSTPIVRDVVARLRELLRDYEDSGPLRGYVKECVAKEFDLSLTTVENYEKMVIDRERATGVEMTTQGLPPK